MLEPDEELLGDLDEEVFDEEDHDVIVPTVSYPVDKGVQTIISVTPHFLEPTSDPAKVQVRYRRAVQTEAHLEPDDTVLQVEDILKYTPYVNITTDAIKVTEVPKKFVLKFDENITAEDIAVFDDNSNFDPSEVAALLPSSFYGKSNLRQMREEMSEEDLKSDAECQTVIMVRPMFLELDEVATVLYNLEVQTSRTFTPNASVTQVDKDLHLYYYHNPYSVSMLSEKRTAKDQKTISAVSSRKSRSRHTGTPRSLTANDIANACANCCDSEEILNRVKDWYDDVGDLLDEEEDPGHGIDAITGQDLGRIEEQIIATVDMTAATLQAQAERMTARCKPKMEDVEIEAKEFADHREPGPCIPPTGGAIGSGRLRDKSCTCDCQLYAKHGNRGAAGADGADFNMCAKKLEQLCKVLAGGGGIPPGVMGSVASSPALMPCPCGDQAPSDLANRRAKTELPLKARACTNRKCNCLYSEGCLHCEQALRTQAKMDPSCPIQGERKMKTFKATQNIDFLTEVDGEYADAYMELLDGDEAYTQTEFGATEEYFATPGAPVIAPTPCTCLANVEMPWDMLLIPPTPQKRPADTVEALIETLPEVVRARLKELTVMPMTEEQLLALTREFLEDNIANADDIDEIQRQILAERARIDAELAAAEAAEKGEGESESDEDDEDTYRPCRPRPPVRSFQVYDPECEVYNEPYLDRLWRAFFCEDNDAEALDPCTSHVEMPWHHIELAKTIVIRKGHHPCEVRTHVKTKAEKDPHRKCGPEYREEMRRQRAMFGYDPNSSCGIATCPSKASRQRSSNPEMTKSMDNCICKTCPSLSLPAMTLKKGESDTNLAAPKSGKLTSCLKGSGKEQGSTSFSTPTIPKRSDGCICPGGPSQCMLKKQQSAAEPKSPQSRTERIAALLDSCKKEMEPIKDGINQLRARIKELNIPDLMAYQESPHSLGIGGIGVGPSSPGMGGFMGGMPPPMCYPPMMCYPYAPPPGMMMYPPGGAGAASANAQVSRLPPGSSGMYNPQGSSAKKCKCKSKHRKKYPSSSYNTSSDTEPTTSDQDSRRRKGRKRSRSRSRSRLLCSCKPQESKTVLCPSIHKPSQQGPSEEGDDEAGFEPPRALPKKCASSACSVPSNASKVSKIPRYVSQSNATNPSSVYKSCRSHFSEKSKVSGTDPSPDKTAAEVRSASQDAVIDRDSLVIVESCATQNTPCDFCNSSLGEARKPILKTPAVSTQSTSCKIRFHEKGGRACKKKCSRCSSLSYKLPTAEAGVEVKRGRPVEESSEEPSR